MQSTLTDQIAVVTGASRGIGRAIALQLAQNGARVIGTATTEAGAQGITEVLAPISAGSKGVMLNVNDAASCETFITDTVAAHQAIHILVNNAGITRDSLSMRLKNDDWEDVIETNLNAVFRLARAAIKPMIKQRYGRIINISSVVSRIGNPGQANYAAAKSGVEGMTRAMARELGGRNVTVNCVAPGFIETDMTRTLDDKQTAALLVNIPLGRLGKPEDIAAAVAFLAAPSGAYITGETLHVNGGMYMG